MGGREVTVVDMLWDRFKAGVGWRLLCAVALEKVGLYCLGDS